MGGSFRHNDVAQLAAEYKTQAIFCDLGGKTSRLNERRWLDSAKLHPYLGTVSTRQK